VVGEARAAEQSTQAAVAVAAAMASALLALGTEASMPGEAAYAVADSPRVSASTETWVGWASA
jgi:hypothetical protein